jgi:hypothetical protein
MRWHITCRYIRAAAAAACCVQGSARVIRCLQDHRSSLSQTCAAALFDHEVRAAPILSC